MKILLRKKLLRKKYSNLYKTLKKLFFLKTHRYHIHQRIQHTKTCSVSFIIFMFTTTPLLQMSGKKAITQSQELWAPKESKTSKNTLHSRLPLINHSGRVCLPLSLIQAEVSSENSHVSSSILHLIKSVNK